MKTKVSEAELKYDVFFITFFVYSLFFYFFIFI